MTTYNGGAAVTFGYYFNRGTCELAAIPKEGGVLPGDSDSRFSRVPVVVLLVAAPILGAMYAIFLPLIGFMLVLQHLGRFAARTAGRASATVLEAVAPAWLPGHAYFADKARKRAAAKTPDQSATDAHAEERR